MTRLLQAIRSFLSILFQGRLPADVAAALGLSKAVPKPSARAAEPTVQPSDGALQLLAILQRDSRLIDFLMEDISGYSDEQVGAAVRSLHEQSRQALSRYLRLSPVIDGVEGTYTKVESPDPVRVKFIGNLPAKGTPAGGTLRHKGWRADKIDLPPIARRQDLSVIAPAEIEVE